MVSSLTSMHSTASLHKNYHIFSFLVKSNLAKLETSHTVILPPKVSVLHELKLGIDDDDIVQAKS